METQLQFELSSYAVIVENIFFLGSDSSKHFFPTIDDDGVARMVKGRFLTCNPLCSHDFWKL
ncbi:hypothetical protein Hanom_Chr07g00618651 [Helianthus anomalus]